jgi:hypothetical protein
MEATDLLSVGRDGAGRPQHMTYPEGWSSSHSQERDRSRVSRWSGRTVWLAPG